MNTDVTVVIRAVGERTLDACYHIVTQQVPPAQVETIREVPFSRAVQRTFEIGLTHNRPFTLAVDADMLLLPNAIDDIITHMKSHSKSIFVLRGPIIDKLMLFKRIGGPHLYQTDLLEKALSFAEDAKAQMRPETYVGTQMQSLGHESAFVEQSFALHDFEQHYTDIFRKSIVHAHKHRRTLTYLESAWEQLAVHDPVYKVASLASMIGKIKYHYDDIQIDVSQYPSNIDDLLQWIDVVPLQPLPLEEINPEKILKLKTEFESNPIVQQIQMAYDERQAINSKKVSKILHMSKQHYGVIGMFRWLTSRILNRLETQLAPHPKNQR